MHNLHLHSWQGIGLTPTHKGRSLHLSHQCCAGCGWRLSWNAGQPPREASDTARPGRSTLPLAPTQGETTASSLSRYPKVKEKYHVNDKTLNPEQIYYGIIILSISRDYVGCPYPQIWIAVKHMWICVHVWWNKLGICAHEVMSIFGEDLDRLCLMFNPLI